MIRYASAVSIPRPPNEVVAYIADFRHWSEWSDMVAIRPDDEDAPHVGSSGQFEMSGGPFKGPMRYEAIGFDAGRSVRYRVTHRSLDWVADYVAEPEGDGTRLSTSGQMRLRGVWRLAEPLMAGEVRRSEARELESIKQRLETAAASGFTPTNQTT
jgi:hypothetical protein